MVPLSGKEEHFTRLHQVESLACFHRAPGECCHRRLAPASSRFLVVSVHASLAATHAGDICGNWIQLYTQRKPTVEPEPINSTSSPWQAGRAIARIVSSHCTDIAIGGGGRGKIKLNGNSRGNRRLCCCCCCTVAVVTGILRRQAAPRGA